MYAALHVSPGIFHELNVHACAWEGGVGRGGFYDM